MFFIVENPILINGEKVFFRSSKRKRFQKRPVMLIAGIEGCWHRRIKHARRFPIEIKESIDNNLITKPAPKRK